MLQSHVSWVVGRPPHTPTILHFDGQSFIVRTAAQDSSAARACNGPIMLLPARYIQAQIPPGQTPGGPATERLSCPERLSCQCTPREALFNRKPELGDTVLCLRSSIPVTPRPAPFCPFHYGVITKPKGQARGIMVRLPQLGRTARPHWPSPSPFDSAPIEQIQTTV